MGVEDTSLGTYEEKVGYIWMGREKEGRNRSTKVLAGNIVISWSRGRYKRNFGQGVRD